MMMTVLLCVFLLFASISKYPLAQIDATPLQVNWYQDTCPDAERIIYAWVQKVVTDEPPMAASLLRLHFHDCFVNGCDASVLLDDTDTLTGEKNADPNVNSLRGFLVIDAIKSDLEFVCPGIVSCADILATVARDSVVLSNGPGWDVQMGRKDSLTASFNDTNNNLPFPKEDLNALITKFQKVGLDIVDMVSLSGAHTIGQARCSTFNATLQDRSSSAEPGDLDFLASLTQFCSNSPDSDNPLAPFDLVTPATFDNQYFINLLSGEAVLPSDHALVAGNSPTLEIVEVYARDQQSFFTDFTRSMLRMGSLIPLTGENGQIRRNCRVIN
ncbi:peroxidase 40-like [Papaver somniferum]|uniref:peroxidase 40-like n=1 Tax=Papaver somniferum TaxID=3469 RepID=UPI000E704DA4|nr:peroxidase 40-like [Papaver somniferum]